MAFLDLLRDHLGSHRTEEGPEWALFSADCGTKKSLPGGKVIRGRKRLYWGAMLSYVGQSSEEMAGRLISLLRDLVAERLKPFIRVRAGAVEIVATGADSYDYPRPAGLSAGLRPNGGLLNGRVNAVGLIDPDIEPMYLDNWFAGVQRQVGRYVVVEADYIGSRTRNGYIRYDVNRFAGDLLDGIDHRLVEG